MCAFHPNLVDTSNAIDNAPDEPTSGLTPQAPVADDSSDLTKLSQQQLVSRLAKASAGYQKAKDPLDLGSLQKFADEMVSLVDELNKRN